MHYIAEILCVGTEILLGNIVNTNAKDLSEKLSVLGIDTYYHTVVGDNPERLKGAVAVAKSRANIIITTGGLGPTFDDLTKQTLAEAFGKKLVFLEDEAEKLRSYFKGNISSKMTQNNYRQAEFPEGATIFPNSNGTAPGCAFEADGVHVIMLPGPPWECNLMFDQCVVPYLKQFSDDEIVSHNIHIFGMGESAVEDKLNSQMTSMTNPTLAPYAKLAEVMLRVTAKAKTIEAAEEMMKPVIKMVYDTLGSVVYGVDVGTVENTVKQLLTEKGLTFASAESCTGGMVASRITDLPGASQCFKGGVVAYTNDAKSELLGVPAELIAEKGAVSREVAKALAEQVRLKLHADLGVGITGIAGPDSDESGTAVGTVFVAISDGKRTYCRDLQLGKRRDRIRTSAAHHAFDMLRRYLTDLEIEKI